jgi:hypothetical protein
VIDALPDFRGDCVGRWDLFDEQAKFESAHGVEARHREAAAICQTCPALAECRAWFDGLAVRHRPPGVVAGHAHRRYR